MFTKKVYKTTFTCFITNYNIIGVIMLRFKLKILNKVKKEFVLKAKIVFYNRFQLSRFKLERSKEIGVFFLL